MRFGLLVVGVALVAFGLITFALSSTSLAMHFPSELAAEIERDVPRARIVGRVADEPWSYETSPAIRLEFIVADPPERDDLSHKPAPSRPVEGREAMVKVVYEGIKPDMFAPGRDVIIDGRFENGVFHASSLLTQCPSKYEPPQGEGAKAPQA